MGASAKRKELRRERFKDVQQIDHQTANEANLEGMSVEKTELSSEEPFAVVGTAETTSDKPKGEAKQADPSTIKKHRFICFIGNLPFTATTEAITKHFATVKPNSIRHGTDRSSGKSRGFAFLEFDNYSRMQGCIRNFHHSSFSDGISASRRINVELTVGGGGTKSNARKAKIKAKNQKLVGERRRRVHETPRQVPKPKQAAIDTEPYPDTGAIHPSRRARITK